MSREPPLVLPADHARLGGGRGRLEPPHAAAAGPEPARAAGIGLGAFCGAMIGAKLPFVLADWEGLLSGRAWLENGKTIVFGLVGGYFGVELAKALLGVRVKTGDSFAVPVAAALAIGRLGCFVAGCCHGTVTNSALGRRFRRRPAPSSHPALRVGLSPDARPWFWPGSCTGGYCAGSSSSSISSPI